MTKPSPSTWLKAACWALFWGILAVLTWQTTTLESDLLKALTDDDPVQDQLFAAYQARDPFRQKLFVHSSEPLTPFVLDKLAGFGYEQDAPQSSTEQPLWWHLALLPKGQLEKQLAGKSLAAAAKNAAKMITKPGGSMALVALEQDPLGIKATAQKRLNQAVYGQLGKPSAGSRGQPGAPPVVTSFSRTKTVAAVTDLAPLYEYLQNQPGLTALASDFFTLENTQAVKQDMQWAFSLATIANIGLFLWLCPSFVLLAFLLIGTSFSYLLGLMVLNISFPYVFTLTLAFTSTFASFNNEYLVHLSGMDGNRWQAMSRGLISAIGTTLIIFVLLAFSSSVLIQQVALISIGGMVGFIALLLSFRELLAKVRYRQIKLPSYAIPRHLQVWLCIGLWFVAGAIVSQLDPKTDIASFRYESSYLAKSRQLFENLRQVVFAKQPVAVDFVSFDKAAENSQHPAKLVAERKEILRRIKLLAKAQTKALNKLDQNLTAEGLRLRLSPYPTVQDAEAKPSAKGKKPEWLGSKKPADHQNDNPESSKQPPTSFLDGPLQPAKIRDSQPRALAHTKVPTDSRLAALRLMDAASPLPLLLTVARDRHFLVSYHKDGALGAGGKNLSPKAHYDKILTEASSDMLLLFAIGFGVILGFLLLLQRPMSNVFYILTPLALTLIALGAALWGTGRPLNFIHLLGFSLVLAVALDYATIAIASGFGAEEQSKILFTGLSTTVSFGILATTSHPVLVDLGITVALGSAAALGYALFIRVRTS